jgi:hypothetical protein
MKLLKIPITAASLICLVLAACASRTRIETPETKFQTIAYFIHVVDRKSKAPVGQAKVRVELQPPAKLHWSGFTDAEGFFQFTWDASHPPLQAYISVQANGFADFDEYKPLTPDKLIELSRKQK